MDQDQEKIRYVYSLYTSETKMTYLQYTAALVVFFYLMEKGHFPNYKHQLLLYDYKNSRRYVWEDKKFMNDINIVRSFDYLTRSRVKTSDYRDINAHQITEKGIENAVSYNDIKKDLTCKCGNLYQVKLKDDAPYLNCPKNCGEIKVNGFLKNFDTELMENFNPSFL